MRCACAIAGSVTEDGATGRSGGCGIGGSSAMAGAGGIAIVGADGDTGGGVCVAQAPSANPARTGTRASASGPDENSLNDARRIIGARVAREPPGSTPLRCPVQLRDGG